MAIKYAEGENRGDKNPALENNINAIKAVVSAVEGTLGPKGMDCMIVNDQGEFIITNDGVTILMEMDASHPAAMMLISAAYAQQNQVGDGTTTMSVMVGQMLESALYHIQRGVPIHKIIEGMRIGIENAIHFIQLNAVPIDMEDGLFRSVVNIAGRGNQDVVELVCKAATLLKKDKMFAADFRFSDCIEAIEGTESRIIQGIIIDRKPSGVLPALELHHAKFIVVEDALYPETLNDELMGTENGFSQYMENRKVFEGWIEKLIELEIDAIFIDRGIEEQAEQMLTDAGVFVVNRVLNEQLYRLCQLSNARPIKKHVLNKGKEVLETYCGRVESVQYDPCLEHIRVINRANEVVATVVISAATGEVTKEKARIAKDAAAALQAAMKSGIVPGGGVIELDCAIYLEKLKQQVDTMKKYGIDCVIDALKKPMYNIIQNAGFHPLEKLEQVMEAIKNTENDHLGIDCDSGEICDLYKAQVIDPAIVKINALKTAFEVSEAILKINNIIKGRNR